MPIGPPITPGVYVTVTADGAHPASYTSIQAPTATMGVIASDIQTLALELMNIQNRSLNGTEGGVYAPSARLEIGGAGLKLTNTALDVRAGADIRGGLNCIDSAIFNAGLSVLTAGSFSCQRPATFTQQCDFSNAVVAQNITGPVSISGANGSFFSGGTNGAEFATDCQIDAKLKFAVAGHEVKRQVFPAGNQNNTLTISDGERFVFTGLTASRNETFQNTGAENGCAIEAMVKGGSGFNAVIKRHDGTTIATLQDDGISGHVFACKIWHDGTNWFVASVSVNP